MLSCIACSKWLNDDSPVAADEDGGSGTQISPASREAISNLTAQDMALKLSGAHIPSTVSNLSHEGQPQRCIESEARSESGKPNGGSSSATPASSLISTSTKDHVLGDMSANTSKNGAPMLHTSSGPVETLVEEKESKERISEVEPGVLITLVSLKGGENELKRIRFSRELFSEWKAQRWWAENYDKVMTLYNVHAHAKDESAAVPTPPRSDQDERDSKTQESSGAGIPVDPPIKNGNLLRRGLYASITSSSCDADRSDDLQSREKSNEQEQEQEWVEEDELGVYVVIRCSPTGSRKIKIVKFSREKFSEMQARMWWEENRGRVHERYI